MSLPLRDARPNRDRTRFLCGWPGCPGVLGERLDTDEETNGVPPRSRVLLPEGFFLDEGLGVYRLSNGARTRLGRGGVPRHPLTGEPEVRDRERYRHGAPARRFARHLAPTGDIARADDREELAAFFGRQQDPEKVKAWPGDPDYTTIRVQAEYPCTIACPRCGNRSIVRLDNDHSMA